MDVDSVIQKMLGISFPPPEMSSFPLVSTRGGGRLRMAEVFRDLGYKTGVEIGVRRGAFSLYLCQTIPGLKLSAIDPWITTSKRRGMEWQDRAFEITKRRLRPYKANVIRNKSLDAVKDFQDRSLDFVFIDGDHTFDAVIRDIIEWSAKVKIGGILSGHDYFWEPQVARAVQAYTENHSMVSPWYALWENDSQGTGGTWLWVVKG